MTLSNPSVAARYLKFINSKNVNLPLRIYETIGCILARGEDQQMSYNSLIEAEIDGCEACPFCRLRHDQMFASRVENTVLAESEQFLAVPALGSFVPGYVLLVSNDLPLITIPALKLEPGTHCPALQQAGAERRTAARPAARWFPGQAVDNRAQSVAGRYYNGGASARSAPVPHGAW